MKFSYSKYKSALVIAGSSSDSGAGIQIDLKTFHSLGIHACSVITCLTAQNTTGVKKVELTKIFEEQLEAVLDDLDIEVIKFGVVPDKEYFKVFEKKCKGIPFVLDPVMVAEADSFSFVKEKETLLEMARNRDCLIITPNLIEAERLTDVKITDTSTCLAAINQFKRLKIKNAVIKGIRYSENELCDVYYDSNLPDLKYFVKERKPFRYHGSGCCFASAIAAFYYLCRDIQNSVVLAEDFIQRAIFRAEKIGKGEVLVVMP